jgi:hypothetical protein
MMLRILVFVDVTLHSRLKIPLFRGADQFSQNTGILDIA